MAQCVVCSTEIRDDARFCPSCGAEQPRAASTDPSDDPFIGQVVNRNFRIEKLLGVGGMGKVYKARQLSLDKTVVIKILHDNFRDDPQLVQRFQREARAASRLNHPNSIQVIDFGQDENNTLFMAQEFLEGIDLFAVLRRDGPLPKERLARIMMQVCSALAEAHENNVIHRDLKPENIMVEDRRGQRDFVKVLDFGIAKIQDPDEKGQALTQAGMVCGTPEYMSPEQARGMALDARSDLYSVGVLVYQLATGELPFQADTPIGIVTKHILEQPVPPSQRVPGLSVDPELERIILRAMVKDTAERYQTAAEMASDFERLLYAAGSTSQVNQPQVTAPVSVAAAGDATASTTRSPPAAPPVSPPASPTLPTPTGVSAAALRVVTHDDEPTPVRSTSAGRGMLLVALAGAAGLLSAGGVFLFFPTESADPQGTAEPASVAVAEDAPSAPPSDSASAVPEPSPAPQGAPEPAPEQLRALATAVPGADMTEPATAPTAALEAALEAAPAAAPPAETGAEPPPAEAESESEAEAAAGNKAPSQRRQKRQKASKVSPAQRAEAKRALQDAQQKWATGDEVGAYESYKRAFQLNPQDATPLQPIAFYHKKNGDLEKSCSAIRRLIQLKGASLSAAQQRMLGEQFCAGAN